MILGIGFIATLTAAVSAYFLSNFGDKQTTLEDVLNKLEEIDKGEKYPDSSRWRLLLKDKR